MGVGFLSVLACADWLLLQISNLSLGLMSVWPRKEWKHNQPRSLSELEPSLWFFVSPKVDLNIYSTFLSKVYHWIYFLFALSKQINPFEEPIAKSRFTLAPLFHCLGTPYTARNPQNFQFYVFWVFHGLLLAIKISRSIILFALYSSVC